MHKKTANNFKEILRSIELRQDILRKPCKYSRYSRPKIKDNHENTAKVRKYRSS